MKLIFHKKLLLTNTKVSKFFKDFASGLLANVKFSKTQFSKMIQSEGILGELLVALLYGVLKAGTQKLIQGAPEVTRDVTKYFVNKEINFC